MTKRHSFEFIKNQFNQYRCDKGHEHYITWNHWKEGHRCPYCDGQNKPSIDYIRKAFKKEGYVLLTKTYINSNMKLKYVCPNNHRSSVTWGNWVSRNARCMKCSAQERATKYHRLPFEYVKSEFEKNDIKLLSNNYKGCE